MPIYACTCMYTIIHTYIKTSMFDRSKMHAGSKLKYMYVHARSQKFLWVLLLSRYPAFWPFFCTLTHRHLLCSIKKSGVVSCPRLDPLGLLNLIDEQIC